MKVYHAHEEIGCTSKYNNFISINAVAIATGTVTTTTVTNFTDTNTYTILPQPLQPPPTPPKTRTSSKLRFARTILLSLLITVKGNHILAIPTQMHKKQDV